MKATKIHSLWIKYLDGEKLLMKLAEHSYEYLMAIVGTPLAKDWVTLWGPNGNLIRVNLGAVVTWAVHAQQWDNPLNSPELYENPLS
jgi:hypothetical protein